MIKAKAGFIVFEVHKDALKDSMGKPFIQNWNNEYACLGYGEELYDTIIDFCGMTGIKVILP